MTEDEQNKRAELLASITSQMANLLINATDEHNLSKFETLGVLNVLTRGFDYGYFAEMLRAEQMEGVEVH